MIIPRTVALIVPSLIDRTPPAHRRAASFALSYMITSAGAGAWEVKHMIMFRLFHVPFLAKPVLWGFEPPLPGSPEELLKKALDYASSALKLTAADAVATLSTILANTDPSPIIISFLLQPIAANLYSLLEYLRTMKTSDPAMKEAVEGLLNTWARASSKEDVVEQIWNIFISKSDDWDVNEDGVLHAVERCVLLLDFLWQH